MGWKDILKDDDDEDEEYLGIIITIYFNRMNSHPDFNEKHFFAVSKEETKKAYSVLKNVEESREKVKLLVQSFNHEELARISKDISSYSTSLSQNRSMGFLQRFADDLGIRIKIEYGSPSVSNNPPPYVEFKFDGLNYRITHEGLFINVGNGEIYVCVVDEKNLPLGDYYAALMGLIANNPDRIPTLGFGIRLARIVKSSRVPLPSREIQIFEPFRKGGTDMESFEELLHLLKQNLLDDVLTEIKQAIGEAFGDHRGFF